jgi:outer membrane protein OmpA-like peptidoglycan-associated protein
MAARTLLDELELPQAQCVDVEDEHALALHAVPALEGDWLQRQHRRAARVTLTGVLTGEQTDEGGEALRTRLGELREKFRAAAPVDFVADITTATRVAKVLIETLEVREVAGRAARFEYAFALREWTDPPRPVDEDPPPRPDPPDDPARETGTLVVEVTVQGQPGYDMSRVQVTAQGRGADGTVSTQTLTGRAENVWTQAEMAPGGYTVRAAVPADALEGSAPASVSAGQGTRVQITLVPRRATALAFVVHFRFDSAFVEPCMRAVLRRAVDFGLSAAHASERLLVVGHTDRTGSGEYNQSLSERRARAVFAFLTFGRDPDGAVREWTAIRQPRPAGTVRTLADRWETRELQWMLQDLGFYPGTIDGDTGPATREAIRAYRCHQGLPPGTHVDDALWEALIRDYLGQDAFAWPAERLLPNCPGEPLKWLGCGEEDPVNNTPSAHRPNRRVELLFVTDAVLPCQPPEPDTFRFPDPGGAGTRWCVGGARATSGHACFLTRPPAAAAAGKPAFALAEPATVDVAGRISREVRQPDGSVVLERVAGRPFVAITPVGEFRRSEQSGGDANPDATAGGAPAVRGTFAYAGVPEGIYTVDVIPQPRTQPVLARIEEEADAPVEGGVVCKRLHAGDATLHVVIVAAPVLREIHLPVAVHVMTALNPTTDERPVRTCPSGPGGAAQSQRSSLTDQQVRDAFVGANRIWGQARVRFEVVDILREAYAFRTACEVDGSEFLTLTGRCGYPGVVNVFFVGDLRGTAEAGFGTSPEGAAAGGTPGVEGCAVGDRFQAPGQGTLPVGDDVRVQVLAHELGHYLDLPHAAETDANTRRLMHPATRLVGLGNVLSLIDATVLVADEVDRARASQGAADDCTPLRLRVTGAAQIGGTLSHRFVFVRDPASPPAVTVDAEIPDAMLDPARGTLAMAGANTTPGGPRQVIVATDAPREVEATATYTPVGGTPVVRRVFVHVVDFSPLAVPGHAPETPGGSTFLVRRQAAGTVRVVAPLSSTPFCIPTTLVTWDPDDPATRADDPMQRRAVSIAAVGEATLRATVAGVTRQVVISVFDLAFTSNVAPFDTTVAQVQTEGILNGDRSSFGLADLFGSQRDSLFRLRIDLPGVVGATLTAVLRSLGPDNAVIEQPALTLTRTAGDRFVSRPVLAIPAGIARADVTFSAPRDVEVIRCLAGGKLQLRPTGRLVGKSEEVRVRGRVTHLNVQAFSTSGTSAAEVRRQIARAAEVWTQAGLELKERAVVDGVAAPAGLDDLDHSVPFDGILKTEERRLLGIIAGGPTRSATASDLNVYYLRSIVGPAVGTAYARESYAVIVEPGQTAVTIEGPSVSRDALAHELGHHFLRGWGGDEHADNTATPAAWPADNVMHPSDPPGRDLVRAQVQNILDATAGAAHPHILFEP